MNYNSPNLDQHLVEAYQRTTYTVKFPPLKIRVGEENESLNVFCFDNNVYTWAFISAWNPRSQTLSKAENELRHQSLLTKVRNLGLRYCEGWGIDDRGEWPAEQSLFVLDLKERRALELARHFEQNAIVCGVFNQVPRLVFC